MIKIAKSIKSDLNRISNENNEAVADFTQIKKPDTTLFHSVGRNSCNAINTIIVIDLYAINVT